MNKTAWLGVLGPVLRAPVSGADEFRAGSGVWSVDDLDTYHAGTERPGNRARMQLCDTGDGACFYAVSIDTRCKKGASYHALVNSDAGSGSLGLRCGAELEDSHLLFAQDFDQIDELLRKATRIGFAIPMQGDEFKAVCVSLTGSGEAIDAMRNFAARGRRRRLAGRRRRMWRCSDRTRVRRVSGRSMRVLRRIRGALLSWGSDVLSKVWK